LKHDVATHLFSRLLQRAKLVPRQGGEVLDGARVITMPTTTLVTVTMTSEEIPTRSIWRSLRLT
jgi:hypothetical protein